MRARRAVARRRPAGPAVRGAVVHGSVGWRAHQRLDGPHRPHRRGVPVVHGSDRRGRRPELGDALSRDVVYTSSTDSTTREEPDMNTNEIARRIGSLDEGIALAVKAHAEATSAEDRALVMRHVAMLEDERARLAALQLGEPGL